MVKAALVLSLVLIASNANFLSDLALKDDPVPKTGGFFSGFYAGIQMNPNFPSPCLRKMADAENSLSSMIQNIGDIFRFGELSLYFDAVSEFANFADNADSTVSICQLDMIMNQLENLFTSTEASTIVVRISTRSESVIKYWQGFIDMYPNDKYESGYNLGKLFSIIFDYTI